MSPAQTGYLISVISRVWFSCLLYTRVTLMILHIEAWFGFFFLRSDFLFLITTILYYGFLYVRNIFIHNTRIPLLSCFVLVLWSCYLASYCPYVPVILPRINCISLLSCLLLSIYSYVSLYATHEIVIYTFILYRNGLAKFPFSDFFLLNQKSRPENSEDWS